MESISDNLDFITFILKNGGKVDKLIASNYTDFSDMFKDCTSLIEFIWPIEFSKYIPTDMRFMFSGCTSLTYLNLSNLNISSGTTTHYIIGECNSLTIMSTGSTWGSHHISGVVSQCHDSLQYLVIDPGNNRDNGYIARHISSHKPTIALLVVPLARHSVVWFILKNGGQTTRFNHSVGKDFSEMFSGCTSLTEFTWPSEFSDYKPTDLRSMFSGCTSLTTLDLSNLDTSYATNLGCMFNGCSSLTNLILPDMSVFNHKYPPYRNCVRQMSAMFSGCSSLTKLNLSDWNTKTPTNLGGMFQGCSSLTELDISGWQMYFTNDFGNMFHGCSSLTELDISGWSISLDCIGFASMFQGCSSLTNLKLPSINVTSKIESLTSMFQGCSLLTELDLSNWSISTHYYRGSGYSHVPHGFDNMFKDCSSLTKLDLSSWKICPSGGSPARDYERRTYKDMFQGCSSLRCVLIYSDIYSYIGRLEIDISKTGYKTLAVIPNGQHSVIGYILKNGGNILQLVDSDFTDFSDMFKDCTSLTEFTWPSEFNMYKPTNLANMFKNCTSLTNLDLSNLDTSSVLNMKSMFKNCTSLINLNTSLNNLSWNTSSVLNMKSMFSGCQTLKSLDKFNLNTSLNNLSWNTSSVTDMQYMFSECSLLTTLDISDWNTSSVTEMKSMFNGCKSLTKLDLSDWNTSSVTEMEDIVQNCSSLKFVLVNSSFGELIPGEGFNGQVVVINGIQ